MTVMRSKSILVMLFATMFMTPAMTAPAFSGPISWASGQDARISHGIAPFIRGIV